MGLRPALLRGEDQVAPAGLDPRWSKQQDGPHKIFLSMSPCTKNCSLNTSTNICEGCGRTLDEIIEWTRMTDEEKQQVMKRLSEIQTIS